MRRLIIILICCVSLPLIAASGLLMPTADAQQRANRSGSTTISVPDCNINFVDHVVLAADHPGVLSFVGPEHGDTVRAGQRLAALRDELPKALLAIAEHEAVNDVQLRFSQKRAQLSEIEYEQARYVNQLTPESISEFELRRLKMELERSLLAVEQAEHERHKNQLRLEEARAQIQNYRIDAPFDGLVTHVHKSRGEAVLQGEKILEMVNTRRVRVSGYVDVRHSWSVQPGTYVTIQLDIPGLELPQEQLQFAGAIQFVSPRVTVKGEVRVEAIVLNDARGTLREGLESRMTIHTGKMVRPGTVTQTRRAR